MLPFIQTELNGSLLALTSTLAGNLFIVGSIANLIVISQASQSGIKLDWKKHIQVGLPVTLVTFLFTAGWLYCIA
jgi:Na+/H+ antiporter NhaD/arsenite permease-like protein